MLIRNQDKKSISDISTNTIRIVNIPNSDDGISDIQIILYGNNLSEDTYETLGHYSTEEKAIKVLDMICEQFRQYTCRYGGNHSDDAVFQMPTDEEVDEPTAQDIIDDIDKLYEESVGK